MRSRSPTTCTSIWRLPMCQASRANSCADRRGDFDQRLGLAGDAHDGAVVEHEAVAVAQRGRVRQIEQELRAAARRSTSRGGDGGRRRRARRGRSLLAAFQAAGRLHRGCASHRIDPCSEQKVALRHRQHLGGRAGQQLAVGASPRRFPHRPRSRRRAVVHHALLGDAAAGILDRDELLVDAELVAQAALAARPCDTNTHRRGRAAPCRRRRTSGGSAPAAASGSRRWDRPSARRRCCRP